jgi:molybdopterin-containing oxidoreductase family iron-sulfur binding subunit
MVIHNSCVKLPPPTIEESFSFNAVTPYGFPSFKKGLEVVTYLKAGIGDGKFASNPWLQEMPDPITKVTWDNYITMNPV